VEGSAEKWLEERIAEAMAEDSGVEMEDDGKGGGSVGRKGKEGEEWLEVEEDDLWGDEEWVEVKNE
jgi:hypothetical protein